MVIQLFGLIFFGAAMYYIPEIVWHSGYFWMALAVMIVVILLYQNNFFGNRENHNVQGKFFAGTGSRDTPKILYSGHGPSGYVHCQSAETTFELYYEFGGGDCVATLYVPGPENWEKQTKLPLEKREEVLSFIGRQVVKHQTTGGKGYFKIEGDWLTIYV